MSTFYMTVGISGSGKTSWCHKNCGENGIVLSSDAIRAELYGDETDQRNPNKIFDIMLERTFAALEENKDVWYDATNITMKYRINTIRHIKSHYPETVINCIVFNVPISICKEWNSKRERNVPNYVIDRQIASFQFPCENEGFNSITVVNPYNYDAEEFSHDIWMKVKKFGDQKNPHHNLSLYEHSLKCAREVDISNLSKTNQTNLIIACTAHDIGKINTQTIDEKGIAHYYNHAATGAYLALNMGLPYEVVQLINYHMFPYNKNSIDTWAERIGDKMWDLVMRLHNADRRAH